MAEITLEVVGAPTAGPAALIARLAAESLVAGGHHHQRFLEKRLLPPGAPPA
jgi:hypothetical protein